MLETSKFNLKYVTENFSCTSENSFLFEMRKKNSRQFVCYMHFSLWKLGCGLLKVQAKLCIYTI